jgi:hypothetical protein
MNLNELALIEQRIREGNSITISPTLLKADVHNHLKPLINHKEQGVQRDDVTVIIPTHRRVPVGLEAFVAQSKHVHVLLNGAVDIPHMPSVQIRLVSWKGHGQTRQEAIEHVQTPYVFLTVDDAIPIPDCLDELVAEMEHGDWDALIARQIPFPTAERYTKDQLTVWTPHRDTTYVVPQCDHVGTLYKTETLRRIPIPNVPIAEDVWWSIGKNVGCVPKACIVHSHPRRTLALIKREYAIHQQLKAVGLSSRSTIGLGDVVQGAVHTTLQYGLKEGVRVTAQNLSRFAAHRL